MNPSIYCGKPPTGIISLGFRNTGAVDHFPAPSGMSSAAAYASSSALVLKRIAAALGRSRPKEPVRVSDTSSDLRADEPAGHA